jgi:hypothetical protein
VAIQGTPVVRGLFETHLSVVDVPRVVRFYRDVVGLEVAYELPERGAAFVWVGEPGGAMLGLWSLGSAPLGLRLHVAFTVRLDELLRAPEALAAVGVTRPRDDCWLDRDDVRLRRVEREAACRSHAWCPSRA